MWVVGEERDTLGRGWANVRRGQACGQERFRKNARNPSGYCQTLRKWRHHRRSMSDTPLSAGGAAGNELGAGDESKLKSYTMIPNRLTNSVKIQELAHFPWSLLARLMLLFTVPVVAQTQVATTVSSWSSVSSILPSGQDGYFEDMAITPNGTVWATGYRVAYLPGAVEFRTNVMRFNGTLFEPVAAPDIEAAPAVNFLQGITAVSDTSIYTVGWSATPGTRINRTRILHYDGTQWTAMISANASTGSNVLYDVTHFGERLWAVGAVVLTGDFYESPLIEIYNGSNWIVTLPGRPAPGTGHMELTGVYAVNASTVYAVGNCDQGGFVLKGVRGVWSVLMAPGTLPTGGHLTRVAGLGKRVLALGYTNSGGLAIRLDVSPPQIIANTSDGASWADATTAVKSTFMTVGSGLVPGTSFASPAIGHRDATGFKPETIGPTFGYFNAAATAPDGTLWAVGATSGKPLAMRRAP